jgi:hypothetical protein
MPLHPTDDDPQQLHRIVDELPDEQLKAAIKQSRRVPTIR